MSDQAVPFPIEWAFPEGTEGKYATHLVINHGQHEFFISFFQIRPPLLIGSDEEIEAQIAELKSVRAEFLSTIIIPADGLEGFIATLQEHLENYRKRMGK
jgi:hypothetical protein